MDERESLGKPISNPIDENLIKDLQAQKIPEKEQHEKKEDKNIDPKLLKDSRISFTNLIQIIIATCFGVAILVAVIVLYVLLEEDEDEEITYPLRLRYWQAVANEEIKNDLSPEDISTGKENDKFLKAPTNWTVVTAMGIIAGDSNEILLGTKLNETNKTQFDKPWWFRAPFTLNKEEEDTIILHIKGINYKADLWVDGNLVMNSSELIGTFVRFDIDITQYLKDNTDTHYVAFLISRPHNQWGSHDVYANDTDLAITFVDWNPEPPDSNMGVWQPVDVEVVHNKSIVATDPFVITKLNDDCSVANVTLVGHFKNIKNETIKNNTISFELGEKIICYKKEINFEPLESKTITITPEECQYLTISSPPLWYPYEMGEPTLLDLTIRVNKTFAITKKVGLREVTSEMSEDKKTKTFIINKRKMFVRGAGYTPDLFLRASPEIYKKHLDYVKHMNLNGIRLEGKFEHEEFYNICDELGLVVMNGWSCGDSWERWKYWKEETKVIAKNSLRSQILRLASHPSIFVFLVGSDNPPLAEIEKDWMENVIKTELWPNEVLSSANEKPVSNVTGPTGVKMTGPYFWVPPHYFVNDKEESWGGAYSFLTEGGPGENPLRKGSFEKVFGEAEMRWPLNETLWMYHCANKKTFNTHEVLFTHVEQRYGEIKDFNDYLRKAAASVIDSHKAMFEAYSLKRYHSTGLIHWMLNNAWPSNIWHLYDYFFTPTPSYFAIKLAGEPLHVLYSYENSSVFITNHLTKPYEKPVTVNSYVLSGTKGEVLSKKSYVYSEPIGGDSQIYLFDIPLSNISQDLFFIHLESFAEDKLISSNTYWLSKNMDKMDYSESTFYNVKILEYANLTGLQELPQVTLKVTKTFKKEGKKGIVNVIVENSSSTFAFMVELRLYNSNTNENIVPVFWSDNYFSILSSNSRNVTAEFDIAEDIEYSPTVEVTGWNFKGLTI